MIIEMRTYTLQPGTVATFEERFAEALPVRAKVSPLAAFWHTEVGPLNRVIHVWPYDSFEERTRCRAEAAKTGQWPPKIGEFCVALQSEIYIPTPFSPPLEPRELGGIYEIRSYTLAPGAIPGQIERWSARKWIARIMISWGIVTILTGFVRTAAQFYAARFLLGAAESSFFPGMIVYLTHWFCARDRSRSVACLYTANPAATLIGAPLAGWLLRVHWQSLAGWRRVDAGDQRHHACAGQQGSHQGASRRPRRGLLLALSSRGRPPARSPDGGRPQGVPAGHAQLHA